MSEKDLSTTTMNMLFERMERGDRQAREELVGRVYGRMEQLCRGMLRRFPNVQRFEATSDVLQNTLVRFLHSLEQIRPASTRDFFGLAAAHIRRELLDLTRHYQAQRRGGGSYHLPVHATDDSSPVQVADDAQEDNRLENWGRFHEAVANLPADEREIVGLLFYHGWKKTEIAQLLQIDERSVRRKWNAACLRLKEVLGSEIPNW